VSSATPDQSPFPSLHIEFNENELCAVLEPSSANNPLTKHGVKTALAAPDYEGLMFHQAAIDELISEAKANTGFSIVIGERRDGTFTLEISKDKLGVIAHMTPAYGGQPVTSDMLLSGLSGEGVSSTRIDLEALEIAAATKKEKSFTVATGLAPVKGVDASFVTLVKGITKVPVEVDDAQLVDYFDQWVYSSVKAGTPLMKRIPPTPGTDGMNVLGAKIPAKPGKNIKFQKSKGASIDASNENLLVAAKDGHPIVEDQGVAVDDMLVLAEASLETGHIDYEGSVAINGDVHSQVVIRSTGDIFVKGTVSNARLEALHDIVIGGGVVSQSGPDNDQDPLLITSELSAGNSIQALFLNQTLAKSGNTIDIQRYALHCELRAKETIFLGQSGGKGAIIGGLAIAAYGITANVVGSNAYIASELHCVTSDKVEDRYRALQREFEQRQIEIKELRAIALKINESQADKKSVSKLDHQKLLKIVRTIKALESRADLIEKKVEEIAAYLKQSEAAFIHIERQVFPNTVLKIGTAVKVIEAERRQTHAVSREGEIELG